MPIETPEEFENWLKDQPQETSALLMARAALRAFPGLTHSKAPSGIIAEKQTHRRRALILIAARAILTAVVAARFQTLETMAPVEKVVRLAGIAASGERLTPLRTLFFH